MPGFPYTQSRKKVDTLFFLAKVNYTMFPEKLVKVALSMYQKGLSIREIAKLIEVSKSCVHKWLHRPEVVSPPPKKVYPKKEERVQKVSQCLKENPDMSLRELAACLDTSKDSVRRALASLGYQKKKVYQVGSHDVHKIASQREAFSKTLKGISYENVISIDETCIYKRMTPTKRWAFKNGRVYLPIQRLESQKYSLIVASTHERIIHAVLTKGAVNKIIFRDFINGIPSKGNYLLMDNVSFHKSDMVRQAMEKKKFIPLYTSPYSPEWNPVEMYFSYLKRSYRKYYHQRAINIGERIKQITKCIEISTFKAWYEHVWKQIKSNFHR
jgi:transposase